MVGELTVGKLCSGWQVPNRMDSDLCCLGQGHYDRTSYEVLKDKKKAEIALRLNEKLLRQCKFECRRHIVVS